MYRTKQTSRWGIVVDFVSEIHALEHGSQNLSYDASALNLHGNVVLSYHEQRPDNEWTN